MTEFHRPTRLQSLIFFFFSLLLAAGVLLWTFILNKGSLNITGPFPLVVNAGNKNISCQSAPCTLALTPAKYTITLIKTGFFDDNQTITIRRGQTVNITAALKFIPVVREVGSLVLPTQNAPLRPPFLGTARFENFPKDAKQTLFSASGDQILLTLGRETYLYDIKSHTVNKIGIGLNAHSVWAGENLVYLTQKDSRQILKLWDNGKIQDVVFFNKPFKNPSLLGGSSANKVLVADQTPEGAIYYLVDIDKKSRKRLELNSNPTNANLTSSYIVFEENATDQQQKNVFAINMETFAKTNLSAINAENAVEFSPDVFIFISSVKENTSGADLGQSISEVMKEVGNEISNPQNKIASSLFLTEFTPKTNTYKNIAEITVKENETVERLTADPNGKKLYFAVVSDGQNRKLFEVLLKAQ